MGYIEKLEKLGVIAPEILMPADDIDLSRYAVVACDQYTSQPEYWDEVEKYVGDNVSALDFIYPECWLEGRDGGSHKEHESHIAESMKDALESEALFALPKGMIYLKRKLRDGLVRKGLMLALDLEEYDYREGSKSLIRATEKTVKERIPARTAIRAKAEFELPHIMVLFADKDNRLMNMLEKGSKAKEALYDFDLMQSSGHLTGYFIGDDKELEDIADVLGELKANASDGMLFAIGDGNHSLAAAKANWESIKKDAPKDHPARYALVELVNLYDEGLSFEPINRILFNVDPKAVQEELGFDANNPISLQDLQPKLDEYLMKHKESSIDYIHGIDVAKELEAKDSEHSLAICWDKFDRDSLFTDVIKNGCLVRKSFSMGHAEDKRFYLEARLIK